MLKKNSLHTVTITDINNLGYGICRIEGIVTFVQGGVTGDELEIKIIKSARDYCVARVEKVISPSPYRTVSLCPVSKTCGGCVYRHITYEHEKQLKRSYVENAFRKAGVSVEVADVTSNDKTEGYRNKVQYPVGADGKIGYYKPKTHDIIECDNCILEAPILYDVKKYIADFIKEKKIDCLRHIYLRCGIATGEVMVCLVSSKRNFEYLDTLCNEVCTKFPEVKCFALNLNDKDTNVILGKDTFILRGNPYIEDELLGCRFRISPQSFYQVNHDMTELLYSKVIELCDLRQGQSFIDLYCGCGTIGLCVANKAKTANMFGVEIIPQAVENAKVNADINGIENAKFLCGDASDAPLHKCDCVIVDPPRKGLTPKLIDELSSAEVEKIVYVSCNPDTLARDCVLFIEKGYKLSTVYPYDLFPRTGHVENVVLLKREKTVHQMKLKPSPFEKIRNGTKTIELRLFDEKRQNINPGDRIVFTNTTTGETLNTSVVKLHCFDSFEELYKSLPLLKCGYTDEDIDKANPSDMEQYYSVEEQKKYGVVGIELC